MLLLFIYESDTGESTRNVCVRLDDNVDDAHCTTQMPQQSRYYSQQSRMLIIIINVWIVFVLVFFRDNLYATQNM